MSERTRAEAFLHVERYGGVRRLTNTSPIDLKRAIYSTFAIVTDLADEGVYGITSRPYYEITDLPSGASIVVENIDPLADRYDEPLPSFTVEDVEWADGLKEESASLDSMKSFLITLAVVKRNEERLKIKEEAVEITQHLERKPHLIRKEGERVVRSDT